MSRGPRERAVPSRPSRLLLGLLPFALAAFLPSAAHAEGKGGAGMVVDYVNRAAEVVRVKVPEGSALDPSMDFVVLGADGKPVARVFPEEILPGSFWSAPLEPRELAAVKDGLAVVKAELDPAAGAQVRKTARARAVVLREQEKRDRKDRLRKQIEKLEGQIRSLRDDDARIDIKRQQIALEGVRRLRDLLDLDNRIQQKIDERFDQRERAVRSREDLADQLMALLRRLSPPQAEVDSLTRRIELADQEADRISREIRDLRDQQRRNQEEPLRAEEDRQRALLEREEIRYRIKGLEEDRAALQRELGGL